MLDCLAEGPWGGQVDVDGDGNAMTPQDTKAWQAGMNYLLSTLREKHPNAILIGNGGNPWSKACPYFRWANGVMNENALGNEWRDQTWDYQWEGIHATMSKVTQRQPYQLLQVDIRRDRSQKECAVATSLSADDLRRFRYGLSMSLLCDDAYFGFDRGDCLHGQLWWFDEYDANLGAPTGTFVCGKWANGVYSREYKNGVVIANTSNMLLSIALPIDATDVSTKQTGRLFKVPPRDGRIFLFTLHNPPTP